MIYFLADIHANLSALESVHKDMLVCGYNKARDKTIILGDIIDYGMRPNEVIDFIITRLDNAIILKGNHEDALLTGDDVKFSSQGGKNCSKYTQSVLSNGSLQFLKSLKAPKAEVILNNKNVLLLHGSIKDEYWGHIGEDVNAEDYGNFDLIVSGHTHKRHLFTKFIPFNNINMRNKKAILFCNPGSVGQPRNHIPKAQYCFCDNNLESFTFRAVDYDIKAEQGLYNDKVDSFYKDRLTFGV